jgi:hypothetical protein
LLGLQRHFVGALNLLIRKHQGVLSLWRGNSAAIYRVVPYMALTFYGYENYRVIVETFTTNRDGE